MRLSSRFCVLLLALGLCASLAPSAGAARERGGSVYDGSGDGPVPQRDLTWVEANNDPNEGRFWGYVELAARPTAATSATFRVFYGTWLDDGRCRSSVNISGRTAKTSRAKAVAARATSRDARPLKPGPAPNRRSAMASGAKEVHFTTRAVKAKGKVFTCFWAQLERNGASTTVYDGTDDHGLTANDPAELYAHNSTSRTPVRKWGRARIRVTNLGSSTARKVQARLVKVPKGVRVKKRTVKVANIRPDKKGTATFRVRKMRPGTSRLKVRMTAAGADAEIGYAAVQVAPKPPKRTRNLAGQYFWTTRITYGQGWDNDAVYFVNKRFAYRGLPKKGVPACRKRTATATGDGCVPYWFNAKRNVLQVDASRGRRVKGGFRFGGDTYTMRLRVPRPGSRLRVDLVNVDSLFCPGPLCTTWYTSFETWKDGRYRFNDTRGRYRILKRGRVRLTSGGKPQVRTLMLMTNRRGKPAPAKEGVFLGGVNYYRG